MHRQILYRALGVGAVLVQYGCIAHCTLQFVADFVICSGPSMLPTIQPDDMVLTEHISVTRRLIERGDVVISRSPSNPRQHICKRVIGLEGDIIRDPPPDYSFKYVPKGHVWLQGDNSSNSTDSRSYGPVPYALIRSRVFYKVWPPSDMGSLPSTDQKRLLNR